MANTQLYRELQNLERKIHVLLSENAKLKEDVDRLGLENEGLKNQMEDQSKNLAGVQNELKINKLVNNIVAEDGTSAEVLKEELDGYIRELDKCIAHLAE